MNIYIEQEIIKNYVRKNKQERIIWELNNVKKRGDVVWRRFNGPNNFIKECLHPINYMSNICLEEYLLKLTGVSTVYYMGEDYIGEDYIGTLSLKEATNRAHDGLICIIYCGNGIGYYQGEQGIGKPPRFMLIKGK